MAEVCRWEGFTPCGLLRNSRLVTHVRGA